MHRRILWISGIVLVIAVLLGVVVAIAPGEPHHQTMPYNVVFTCSPAAQQQCDATLESSKVGRPIHGQGALIRRRQGIALKLAKGVRLVGTSVVYRFTNGNMQFVSWKGRKPMPYDKLLALGKGSPLQRAKLWFVSATAYNPRMPPAQAPG